jgi:hypothetical protein
MPEGGKSVERGEPPSGNRSIEVKIVYEDRAVESPAFFCVKREVVDETAEKGGKVYILVDEATAEERARREILDRAYMDALAFQRRYASYRELFSEKAPELLTVLDLDLERPKEREGQLEKPGAGRR